MDTMWIRTLLAFTAVASLLASGHAVAQAWPTKQIRIVVPYLAGSFTDVAARRVAVELAEPLGQAVIVENRTGASGIIGIELLAAAQGIDFRRPLKSSPILESEMAAIRADVPFYAEDRFFAPDIAAARALVDSGRYRAAVDGHIHLPSGT